MTLTQSGYPVIAAYGDPLIVKTAPVNAAPGVRAGDTHTVLSWVMDRFDQTVAKLKPAQCWGYAPRKIRGGSDYWSNHASGTAIDLNAADFPQGTRRMTLSQIDACRAIVAQSGGAIRWGGDYGGSTLVDQQHFEIASATACQRLAAKLRAAPKPTQEDDMPTAREVADTLLDTKIRVTDAAQGPNGSASEETVRDILARLIRLTALTQDWVRKGAHPKEDTK